MNADTCRPVGLTVDGERVLVRVHGSEPMGEEDRKHLAELVRATRRAVVRRRRGTLTCPCGRLRMPGLLVCGLHDTPGQPQPPTNHKDVVIP